MIKMIAAILLAFALVYFTIKKTKDFIKKYKNQYTSSQKENILISVVLFMVALIITCCMLFLTVVAF